MSSDAHQATAAAISRSFLSALPTQLMERLLSLSVPMEIPAGGVLYREAGFPRCLLVISGLVRVYMVAPNGRQVTVRYVSSGDVLGIPTLVGGPAPVDVQILADASLLILPVDTLRAFAQQEPQVGWLFAEEITRRLYATLEALAGNTFGSVRQLVARHLLDLAAMHQYERRLVAPITQQELADAVGSVRPVVARALGELRDAGLVGSSSGGLVILDASGLHAEAWHRDV